MELKSNHAHIHDDDETEDFTDLLGARSFN